MDFIEELLLESEKAEEQQRLEMSRLRADQLLMAIQVLEGKIEDVDKMTTEEIQLIEHYRKNEEERLMKRVRWFAWNLEQFMRSTDEKTINLPHGTIKLRLGRDKVEIADLQKFLADKSNQQFLRVVPEAYEPDLQSLNQHIKRTGHLPEGVNLIPAEAKFHYTTIKRSENNEQTN
ncbi:MAG: host-nuclease inhibitor Gam family protein [Bacteroidota bacterium]|jgi:phage host-nuclease inhibitor protein Gam